MNNEPINTGWPATAQNHSVSGPAAATRSKDNLTFFQRLPQRYVIKDADGRRMLTCLEAPNISVQVEAGLTVSASAAHKSSPGTIYLDGVAQGTYVPRGFFPARGPDESLIYLILIIPLALELLFRSLAHGILAKDAAIQSCRSGWFLSYPTVASAVLYAAFIAYLVLLPDILNGVLQMKVAAKCLSAATAFGMAAAIVRERSQSVFPVILLHVAALVVYIFLKSI